jgi:hypothetical protein
MEQSCNAQSTIKPAPIGDVAFDLQRLKLFRSSLSRSSQSHARFRPPIGMRSVPCRSHNRSSGSASARRNGQVMPRFSPVLAGALTVCRLIMQWCNGSPSARCIGAMTDAGCRLLSPPVLKALPAGETPRGLPSSARAAVAPIGAQGSYTPGHPPPAQPQVSAALAPHICDGTGRTPAARTVGHRLEAARAARACPRYNVQR